MDITTHISADRRSRIAALKALSAQSSTAFRGSSSPLDFPRISDAHSYYESDAPAGSNSSSSSLSGSTAPRNRRGFNGAAVASSLAEAVVREFVPVPMCDDGVTPVYPIEAKGLRVHSLGKVVWDRPAFHEKRYIWPAGFRSEREYASMAVLDARCTYVSEILDIGADAPLFRVTCLNPSGKPLTDGQNPATVNTDILAAASASASSEGTAANVDEPVVIEGPTASGVWAEVGKRYFMLRRALTGKDTLTQISGPEMFGYAIPVIAKLVQEMPGAEQCSKYQMKAFAPRVTTAEAASSSSSTTRRGNRKRKPTTKAAAQRVSKRRRRDSTESDESEPEFTDSESDSASSVDEQHFARTDVDKHDASMSSTDDDSGEATPPPPPAPGASASPSLGPPPPPPRAAETDL